MTYLFRTQQFVLGTILAGLASLAAVGGGHAAMIPITNPTFDATNLTTTVGIADNTNVLAFGTSVPITSVSTGLPTGDNASALGWTVTADAGDTGGVRFASLEFPLGGNTNLPAAFTGVNNPDGLVTLGQTLTGIGLQAGNIYTLGIDVGAESTTNPIHGTGGVNVIAFPNNVSIEFLAGATVLATTSLGDPTGPAPATGGWAHWTLTYTAPTVGVPTGDLGVLISTSGFTTNGTTVTAHAEFDNVTLDDAVPEPSAFAILLLAGIPLLRRRRA